MRITVKMFASLRIGRFGEAARDYRDQATIREIVQGLGIPPGEVGIALRNGTPVTLDEPLAEGDSLALMPRISGG